MVGKTVQTLENVAIDFTGIIHGTMDYITHFLYSFSMFCLCL